MRSPAAAASRVPENGRRSPFRLFRLGTAIVASVLAVLGCSALLELEPDCDVVSNCLPYTCNESNTACLDNCIDDSHCSEGFSCDRSQTVCVDQGCVAQTEVRSLFSLAGDGLEYAATFDGETFWIVAASSTGVGLLELTEDGDLPGGFESVINLDGSPSLPVWPDVVSMNGDVAVFWRGRSSADVFDVRLFQRDQLGVVDGPRVFYQTSLRQTLDQVTATWNEQGALVGWISFLSRNQALAVPLNADLTYGSTQDQTAPTEAAVSVTDGETAVSLPVLLSTTDRNVLLRRESFGADTSMIVSYLDSEHSPINDLVLSSAEVTSIDDIGADTMGGMVAAAWIETLDGTQRVMRGIASVSGVVLGATESQDRTDGASSVSVAAALDEFAITWTAEDNGESDVFMRRYDDSGNGMFVTFSASGRSATDPSRVQIVRTDDGYAVFWIELGDGAAQLMFRRFRCSR